MVILVQVHCRVRKVCGEPDSHEDFNRGTQSLSSMKHKASLVQAE